MKRSSKKLPLMSILPDKVDTLLTTPPPRHIIEHTKLVLLFIVVMTALSAFLGISYGWFFGSSGEVPLVVDSNGIKADVDLYYATATDLLSIPTDAGYEYTLQTTGSKRTLDDNTIFGIGSTLIYKITVTNRSGDEPHSDEDNLPGTAVDISLSMPELNSYFERALDIYATDPNSPRIDEYIAGNSGVILFRLADVQYEVTGNNPLARTVYTLPGENNEEKAILNMVYRYGYGESFFEYSALEDGDTLSIYFIFECLMPYNANQYYRSFRDEYKTNNPGISPTVVDTLVNRELNSLVIEKTEGGGQTQTQMSAGFHIPYFRVTIAMHAE